MRLDGKVAIITGAASGMGREEALAFAQEGARVVLADIDLQGIQEVEKKIKQNGGQAIAVEVDITKNSELEHLKHSAHDHFGQIDILINNAGIFDKYTTSLETTEEQWDLLLNINLKAVYKLCNVVLPEMIERGQGNIVNIASIAGLVAGMGGAAYTASKHGVVGYTKHLSSVYAKEGIKINAICPGTVRTPMTEEMLKTRPTDKIPVDRFGEVQEVAELAVFLASDEAKFMNGAAIPIDGGYTVR